MTAIYFDVFWVKDPFKEIYISKQTKRSGESGEETS